MLIENTIPPRKFRFEKPRTPDETVSAIYEELSETPLNKDRLYSDQTVKGYLHAIHEQIRKNHNDAKNRKEDRSLSESFSVGMCGVLGLILVFISSQSSSDFEWWNRNSYFSFALGTVLTVMFVAASIEKSSFITQMLKYTSVKLLCAFLFSAAVIYSTAQANTVLNEIFGIDGSNLPFSRAILSAAYFLKICTPSMFLLAFFAFLHILAVWSAKGKDDVYTFPWNSAMFIVAALVVAVVYWGLTHGAFGDSQIKQKAYKLAHYLDFNTKAYCVDVAMDKDNKSFLFFGNDQNKILIDNRLELNETFAEFLKGGMPIGHVDIPTQFKVQQCIASEKKG